ncbi:MAG: ketoacyl-ACP synthase III [candidate division Zixibacteria bacterium]|nr:ketoacyl-ACP synthase III [candidate division Zixibacteria bacterium]
MNSRISGIGSYVPKRLLTNSDLAKIVDTNDEWIVSRTGIKERHICEKDEASSDMASEAGKRAMESAGVKPEEIDFLITGTVTPDYRCPSASCIIQEKLGLINAGTMDLVAACAGFLHGLATADAFIKIGKYKKIMVIGVEKLSSITDYTDRNTCVLFGDGAGAAIIEATEDGDGILATYLKSDGRFSKLLWIPNGGSAAPIQDLDDPKESIFLQMNGKEVYKHAVREMADASLRVLDEAGVKPEELKLLVAHQANIRIIDGTAKRLKIPKDKVFLNIAKYGNTSAASVPIALDEALQEGKIQKGDLVLMAAFGGGLTWASTLIRW